MTFQSPIWLWLLLWVPVLTILLARAQSLRTEAAARLRGRVSRPATGKGRTVRYLGAFAFLILALARPGWNPHPGPPSPHGRDVVIALDISRSMLAQDVFPSRLDAARIAIHEGLEHMHNQRIGLMLFAGAASVRVPLTRDHQFVRYMLDRASPNEADVGSTSLQSAVEKAVDIVLRESEAGKQDLIIFTDGEDHISNIDTTSQALRDCGARVLIIGLGDPVAGARIPDAAGTNTWVQHKGQDVISRLNEDTLQQLAEHAPNVTYHAAATRPFNLATLYAALLSRTLEIDADDPGQPIYTEGYALFIGIALLLLWLPFPKSMLPFMCLALLAGCAAERTHAPSPYSKHVDAGLAAWNDAQGPDISDPRAALSMLLNAREYFLRAALSRPGDLHVAQLIAGIARDINRTQAEIAAQERQEEDLQQQLQEAIARLQVLTEREDVIAKRSQKLLRKRPNATREKETETAPPTRTEQREISTGTEEVLGVLQRLQSVIRDALSTAYGDDDNATTTEYDEAVDTLHAGVQSQHSAIEALTPEALVWPHAGSAMLIAHRKMETTLQLLSDQSQEGDAEDEFGDDMDREYEEDMEWSESESASALSMPMNAQSFKTALENRSLPSPNYTSEEVLMQEAENQDQRARQKANRAGAQVEKNW